jgi:uncharacterized protein (TIGR03435 family)
MGLGAPLRYVVQASWNYGANRTIFPADLPPVSFAATTKDRYDFIASLPSNNREMLRQEIEKQFGLVGHIETVETNVLLLKVKFQNARDLVPSTKQEGGMQERDGFFECDGEPISLLSGILEARFGTPVVNQTGLIGNFDIKIKWRKNDLNDLKQVLLNQLGLELIPGREPIEMLVVEKAQ